VTSGKALGEIGDYFGWPEVDSSDFAPIDDERPTMALFLLVEKLV
jgi:hypothetical protein